MATRSLIVDMKLKTHLDVNQIGCQVESNSLVSIWYHIVGYKLMTSVWILIDTFMWVQVEHKSLFQSQFFTKKSQIWISKNSWLNIDLS
jgi:hypothetical protein